MSPYLVRREILIHASRETVFRFFTDSSLFAKWWGEGSTIDPRPGGSVQIRYPNGIQASGEVLEIVDGDQISFSFGYESGKPFGPGATVVTLTFGEAEGGTRVTLTHECPSEEIRDMHVPGWRYQMAVFAKVAADEQHSAAESRVDAWYAAWGESDDDKRRADLASILTDDVEFRDSWGVTSGLDDLLGHIAAARVHLSSAKLERQGDIRRSHGVVLADFIAANPEGEQVMAGTNVFLLAPDGRIRSVTGLA